MAEMTFITGPERRRQWHDEERQRILEAAFALSTGTEVSAKVGV
jgi:hypothetical protein